VAIPSVPRRVRPGAFRKTRTSGGLEDQSRWRRNHSSDRSAKDSRWWRRRDCGYAFAAIPHRERTDGPVAGGATGGQRFQRPVGSVLEALHTGTYKPAYPGSYQSFRCDEEVRMQNEPQTREAADFNGRRILVTGGTKGIGEAIVDALMRGGGKWITTARSIPRDGTLDRFVQADVSTREGIDQVVKAIMDRLGGLDILIHHGGGSQAPAGGD